MGNQADPNAETLDQLIELVSVSKNNVILKNRRTP